MESIPTFPHEENTFTLSDISQHQAATEPLLPGSGSNGNPGNDLHEPAGSANGNNFVPDLLSSNSNPTVPNNTPASNNNLHNGTTGHTSFGDAVIAALRHVESDDDRVYKQHRDHPDFDTNGRMHLHELLFEGGREKEDLDTIWPPRPSGNGEEVPGRTGRHGVMHHRRSGRPLDIPEQLSEAERRRVHLERQEDRPQDGEPSSSSGNTWSRLL